MRMVQCRATPRRGKTAALDLGGTSMTCESDSDQTQVEVRGMILWRREADGTWRVAMERIG